MLRPLQQLHLPKPKGQQQKKKHYGSGHQRYA
jgi:hypothetical protein